MDVVSFMTLSEMPAATVARPRQARVAPSAPAMTSTAPSMYSTFAGGLVDIGCGVGSSRWTNALAVNMKATMAFGHGPCRLLEHST
jgi:hypothetical protein